MDYSVVIGYQPFFLTLTAVIFRFNLQTCCRSDEHFMSLLWLNINGENIFTTLISAWSQNKQTRIAWIDYKTLLKLPSLHKWSTMWLWYCCWKDFWQVWSSGRPSCCLNDSTIRLSKLLLSKYPILWCFPVFIRSLLLSPTQSADRHRATSLKTGCHFPLSRCMWYLSHTHPHNRTTSLQPAVIFSSRSLMHPAGWQRYCRRLCAVGPILDFAVMIPMSLS